jgi:hypothetical protein
MLAVSVLGKVLASVHLNAQDYKHTHGLVKEDGKVLDASGKLLDAITGKRLGKAEKNGGIIRGNSLKQQMRSGRCRHP